MDLEGKTIGFAMTGSFCTFKTVVAELENLKKTGANIIPIMSQNAYGTDTRFGTAESFVQALTDITGNEIIHTIKDAEPIGPKKLLDALIIAPCTGNTLGKLANGITDTPVTLAAKAHLRNERPLDYCCFDKRRTRRKRAKHYVSAQPEKPLFCTIRARRPH